MLSRHATGCMPIKTDVSSRDLMIASAIITIGLSPCPYQTLIRPEDFEPFQDFCDYFSIDIDVDYDNITLTTFCLFLVWTKTEMMKRLTSTRDGFLK